MAASRQGREVRQEEQSGSWILESLFRRWSRRLRSVRDRGMDLFNLDEGLLWCSVEKVVGQGGPVGRHRVDSGTAMRKDCKQPDEPTHDGGLVYLLAVCYCHRNAQDNQLIKMFRCRGTCL